MTTTSSPARWDLVPYVTQAGRCHVLDYLQDLRKTEFKVFTQFQDVIRPLMEERGPFEVGEPYWRDEGGKLYAICFKRHRIYCSVEPVNRVVMYLAIEKRWRTFRNEDRKICETRRKDAMSADYDQQSREFKYLAYLKTRSGNVSA